MLRTGAHDQGGRAIGQVATELGRARHDVLAIRDAASEQVAEEIADGHLAGAFGCLGALQLESDQVRHEAQQSGGRRLTAGPEAQLPDGRVGHQQLDRLGAAPRPPSRAFVLGR